MKLKSTKINVAYQSANLESLGELLAVAARIISVLAAFLLVFAFLSWFHGVVSGLSITLVFLAVAALAALSAVMSVQLRDNLIVMNREGVSLPGLLGGGLRRKVDREWNSIRKVDLDYDDEQGERLLLYFEGQKPVVVETKKLDKNGLEQMVVAVEVWGSNAEGVESLARIKERLRGVSPVTGDSNYTRIWEDELTRRFGSTNFVPLEPGNMIGRGRLKIIRQLGFGGLAAVYLVLDNDGNRFALKESVTPLNTNDARKGKAIELFIREARLLMQLSHRSIARVHDQFVENGRQYLLLEYVQGANLRQLVKENGSQAEDKVVAWAFAMAEALAYMHSLDPPIIHRDISPDNIVLKNDGSVVLVDFGAAKEFLGTATGTMIGKQCFVAPEQFRGKPVCQSDIYSLGATMFFLLTGRDPEPLTPSSPWLAHKRVSEGLDLLIAAMTDQDPEKRPATAALLLERLGELARDVATGETSMTGGKTK